MHANAKHEIVVCGVPFESEHEVEALKTLKSIGVTSVQIYTFWNRFEPKEQGSFDWSFYDRQVELIDQAGLKYVPFIIMGPRYGAPDWWLEAPEHVGLTCLEHGKVNPIESIWNPHFRDEVQRVLQAFAEHYVPMNILESIQPGISGDYGESIMPVLGNWPGAYHTHAGYWCGGEDAKQSFSNWLQDRYGEVVKLNEAWRSCYHSLAEVEPLLPHRAPSRTAQFDMLDWYRASMTEYTEFWMDACRKHFPNLPVYMCTGGVESPEHASSFSAQAKVCAKYDGGIRLTNEGNQFYKNFFITAYAQSACDFYGAYMGLEPVGPMIDTGVVARIFGSAAYGNRQIFHYYGNLFKAATPETRPAAEAVKEYLDLIQERPLPKSVGVFWPGYYTALHGGIPEDLSDAVSFIRGMTNCMPVNDDMILDGALERHDLLVAPIAGFARREVLLKIVEWVEAGGTVLTSRLTTDLELQDVAEYNALFGVLPDSEYAAGIATQIIAHNPAYPRFSALERFVTNQAWMGLAEDVEMLSSTQEGPGYSGTYIAKVSAAFLRHAGKGTAIFYGGSMAFEPDPEAIFPDPGVYKALLTDVLQQYAQTTDLTPSGDEIALAEIDNQIYALTMGRITLKDEAPRVLGE
jgi:hypothetical protein